MSRRRKPFIVRMLIGLLTSILTICLVVGGACVFVKVKYDISVVETFKQVKLLGTSVDESTFTSKFAASDMESTMNTVNAQIKDLITYDEATQKYSIGSGLSSESKIKGDIKLTGKQVGALLNDQINSGDQKLELNIANQTLAMEMVQVEFYNIRENYADMNVVVKIELTSLKKSMTNFPLNLLAKKLPDNVYISSTVGINKKEGAVNYEITSTELKMNSLSAEETKKLIGTFNTLLKCGTSDDLNLTLGKPFVNALIGNSEAQGLTYTLHKEATLEVADYDFVCESDVNYFVIKA